MSQLIDKRDIEAILLDQREELYNRKRKNFCRRAEEILVDLDSPQAQAVIGVRRSGKSTLCFLTLENAHVNYGYVDFDDERLSEISASQLNDVLEILYKINGEMTHLFFDEIQNVDKWYFFVNRLLRANLHIVLTGSNAKLLSGELATHLTGRAKQIHLYPFSFREYCEMKGTDVEGQSTRLKALRSARFDEYLHNGGFPELLLIKDSRTYVKDLVDNILRRDIEQRYSIVYKSSFEQMAQHLLNIAPTKIVAKDLAAIFHIKSEHTAKNYLDYLKQSFVLIGICKYSTKSKIRITQEKVYPIDVSLMNRRENAMAGENLGWRLETVVLLALMRKCKMNGWDIYYLDERSGECDFIVCNGGNVIEAIQVSFNISNPKTFKREIKGLLLAAKKSGCRNLTLLTDHNYGTHIVDDISINILPVSDWVLQ